MDAGAIDTNGRRRARIVSCAECGCSSGLKWRGWRAYRVDDPETDELPELGFFCPSCAQREFGVGAWRRSAEL
jgi:hypothetical protein